MVTEAKDRQLSTALPVQSDDGKRLPHERDESPDGHEQKTRSVIRQAASDLEHGLVDTDLHGIRGVEKVQPRPPGTAEPQPDRKRD